MTIDGSTSFGRFNYDPTNTVNSGTAYDDFAFDAVNDTLYVNGTVFIDGDLTITVPVVYKGNGAIVCNGDIQRQRVQARFGNAARQTVSRTRTSRRMESSDWSPPRSYDLNGGGGNANKTYTTPPDTAAALFCAQTIRLDNNLCFAGSIIASIIEAPTRRHEPAHPAVSQPEGRPVPEHAGTQHVPLDDRGLVASIARADGSPSAPGNRTQRMPRRLAPMPAEHQVSELTAARIPSE